jgi:hypothetical protein
MLRIIVAGLATVVFGVVAASAQAVAITAPAPGASTADATPTLAGTAEPGPVTLEISQAGAATASFALPATATAAGTFSTEPTTALSDGGWTVIARQATAAGVQSSAPVTFTVDTVAPVVTLATPAEGTTAATSRPVFTGSAGAGVGDGNTVAVALSGPVTTTLVAARGPDGSFAFEPIAALPDGAYVATATQVDAASNVGTSAPRAFRIDTRAPSTTIVTGPVPTATGGTRTVRIEFGADESATFRCVLDGVAVAPCAPPQLILRRLTKGRHRLTITAIDGAGNADPTPATRTFTVDVSAPDITISRTAGATSGGSLRFTLRCPNTQAVGPCAGTLSAVRDGRSVLAKAVAFTIQPGKRAVLRAKLTPAARRALRRNGRLAISLRLIAVDGRNNVGRATARRTLTLPGFRGK